MMSLKIGEHLKKWLWKYSDVLCYLMGLFLIDYVIFLCNLKLGILSVGIELVIIGGILSFLPNKDGER